jgi:hypothetical protein
VSRRRTRPGWRRRQRRRPDRLDASTQRIPTNLDQKARPQPQTSSGSMRRPQCGQSFRSF